MGSLDAEQRKTLYARAEQILARDAVTAPMYTSKEIVVHAPKLPETCRTGRSSR